MEYFLPGKGFKCCITEITMLCFLSKLNYFSNGLMFRGHRFRKETLGFLADYNGLDATLSGGSDTGT